MVGRGEADVHGGAGPLKTVPYMGPLKKSWLKKCLRRIMYDYIKRSVPKMLNKSILNKSIQKIM